MGKQEKPGTPAQARKVGREMVNPHVLSPVRIVVEAPMDPLDDFFLEPVKGDKTTPAGVKFGPISKKRKIGGTNVVFEFENIHGEKTYIYQFVHARIASGGGLSRDIVEGHMSGSILVDPGWTTPGLPSIKAKKLEQNKVIEARTTPPIPGDPLLREATTDFTQIRVEEPKIGKKL
jgi:hypothetical protein